MGRARIIFLIQLFILSNSLSLFAVNEPVYITKICLNRFDSTATIRFKNPSDPCASFKKHYIYGREDILSSFSLRDSIDNLLQEEKTIKLPNTRQWQFFMVTKFACNGIDTFISDTLMVDLEQPIEWELDSVSVDLASQKAIIGWSPHPARDKKGYFLYFVSTNNSLIFDSTLLFFKDTVQGSPNLAPQKYSLATYDSCMNTSPISSGHTSIFLSGVYDTCARKFNLTWTKYQPSDNETYYIKESDNPLLNYQVIDSQSNSSLFYEINNLLPNRQYCFVIQVHNPNPTFTSTSNRLCIQTPVAPTAENYIQKVTVNESEMIEVHYQSSLDEGRIHLLKLSQSNKYELLRDDAISTTNNNYLYTDNTTTTAVNIYDYFLAHIDKCGNPIPTDTSELFNSILLQATENPNGANLIWNSYVNFKTGIGQYQILKHLGDEPPHRSTWNILSSENPATFNLIDNYETNDWANTVCYVVRAIENNINIYGRQDTAYSNTVCFKRDLTTYFPNAFIPNEFGLNNRFAAVGVGIDEKNSELEIFNRWGELIFRTNKVTVGWDGKDFSGKDCPPGVYVYKARITGDLGKKTEHRGVINLLR
jgi:gliding motility-associated-like protein